MAHAAASLEANLTRATRLAVDIGGFTFGMWCVGDMPISLDPEHEPFLVRGEAQNQACDIELDVSWADALELPAAEPSFLSGGLWSAYVSSTGTKFYFASPAVSNKPYKAAWFDPRFERGHVLLNRSAIPAGQAIFPLEYPLDELVMMHRLALGQGVELHALGLADDDGSGYLFLGHSGAGKSTAARIWLSQPGVRLLSDDRIIVREQDGEFWMYGTPWHGEAELASASRAQLRHIFFIHHGRRNSLKPKIGAESAALLFSSSFPVFYSPEALEFTIEFYGNVVKTVPCSKLTVVPNFEIIDFIRQQLP